MTDHTHEPEYLIIPNEDGEEEKFEIMFTFEHDETGKKYMFVTPAEEDEEDVGDDYQEVLAFRYEDEDGDFRIEMIDEDNEEEWDMVEEMFNTLFSGLELEEEEDHRE
ncbi:DUF1292 domain-containing protein [Thermoactinomyces sp. CICC 10523]|uniref:DUF1292 domain-containing protein n=1 Tax=Thermoactinomyces sp. CICC 10523 TaxID=2767428 RepID=UPI0018DC2A6C|nr:DUF1292 domain-containing protein [Thermoactinomyces sp. CICC 10523]MBH8597249.1 DUF1292 domain-containing protein [Thermoactinomyces sp. CICC 10523]